MRGTAAEAAAYTPEVDARLAGLRGKPAHATLPAGAAPNRMDAPDGPVCGCGEPSRHESGWCGRKTCPAHCPLSLDEIARRGRIGQAVCIFSAMSDDDQRVWLRMLTEGGSYEKLRATCTAIKEEAREPVGTPNNWRSTPPAHVAIGNLLGAVDDYRRLVLPHPEGCMCKLHEKQDGES